jgi:hypothetical protein
MPKIEGPSGIMTSVSCVGIIRTALQIPADVSVSGKFVANVDRSSQRITTLLFVLSSSMRTASPLPPHLGSTDSSCLVEKRLNLDANISSIRHLAEPEYSAFVVMQVVSKNIAVEVEELVKYVSSFADGRSAISLTNIFHRLVKALVGEVDFSFNAKS